MLANHIVYSPAICINVPGSGNILQEAMIAPH